MGIADDDIERVRSAVGIVDVIQEHVGLRKQGSRWVGLCPFHGEKTPSFSVNAEMGRYYCLAGETRVVTWDGLREIKDLAGGTHRILTQQGHWVEAPFRSFGVQPLRRLILTRNGQRKTIFATPEHRWLVRPSKRNRPRREILTDGLKKGHGLCWSFPQNTLRHLAALSPQGIAHGITFGDGTLFKRQAAVDLHGDKDAQLLKWFPLNRTYTCREPTGDAFFTKVVDLPRYFKERPDLDESPSYLAGWLAGYFAADGHVSKDGTCLLSSARREDLQYVRDVCTRLGIGTYGMTTQVRTGLGLGPSEVHRVHFFTEDLPEDFFLIDQHRMRFMSCQKPRVRRGWVVESVEETDRIEEVFCAEVEGTHSFVLEDNILTGNCFGCQAKGDVITFVREISHLDFVGAVETLAGRAGITLTYDSTQESGQRKRRALLVEAMSKAVDWYHQRLLTSPDAAQARGYLRSRGYDGEVVRTYKLGWAPDDWDAASKALGLSSDLLRETGLAFLNKRDRLQDSFRARVLFPIFDAKGDAVAIGGRVLPGSTDPAKYKNSPSTSIYDKSETLYGLNWAKQKIVAQGEVVVCEGYTDVIGMAVAGVPWAVATCGTALTERHFSTLKNFSRRIVLAFDADAAGQGAAEKFYEWERRHDIDVYVAALPAGADPGDLARTDPEALRQAVSGAIPFLEFRLGRLLAGANLTTAEGRARAAESAMAMIAEHPNELVRDQYVMQVADRTRIDAARLRSGVRGTNRPAQAPSAPRRRPTRHDSASLLVLRLAVHEPASVAPWLHDVLFTDPVELAAFRALAGASTLHEAIEVADPEAAELLQRLAVEEIDVEAEDVVAMVVGEAVNRTLQEVEADARATDDPLAAADVVGWLKLRLEELRDPVTRLSSLGQLVPFLVARVEEGDE